MRSEWANLANVAPSAPWLGQNVSPAIPVFFAYLFAICMSSFIHASVSDPGVGDEPVRSGNDG